MEEEEFEETSLMEPEGGFQDLGHPRGASVNGTPFLSFFKCDCFENMATGSHNRVFWWQVLGPPTGVR